MLVRKRRRILDVFPGDRAICCIHRQRPRRLIVGGRVRGGRRIRLLGGCRLGGVRQRKGRW